MGAVLILAGCASTPPAPVEDRSIGGHQRRGHVADSGASRLPAGSYRVRRGDTLYSIAFRNGLDYRDLASANGIDPPYTIYVDQVIRLDRRARATRRPVVAKARKPPRESRTPPASGPSTPPPQSGSRSAQVPPTAVAAEPARVSPQPAPSRPPPPGDTVDATPSAGIVWRWPADGPRDGGFVPGDQTHQGINITGKSGDPVRAAADGVVVYSGNGLIGYGELIIIKHNSTMLSAYGHNRRRLVQEGDRIKAGQQIAEMGSSSASRDMLHFEIRRNGKPVDPLAYLPSR
ncbi:MAG: peptidoglycan DD-metalloendopeptidase family protein [Dokdonella sp.]|nr:peptidoglycan DD-metalloendopeptidase family protein [Dokdonella sp.]MCB1574307.1 peptidoglycan DD-metalloendopeptidase family protein [Xanthomonadales bacterium]